MPHCLIFFVLLAWSSLHANEIPLKQWKRLLFYSDDTSLITHKDFFISENGQHDPLGELNQSIHLFQQNNQMHCLYPARFEFLSRYLKFKKKSKCNEFNQWRENFSAGTLYYVYSSSYPSNPASILGHTFLRFNRAQNHGESNLLGYSIAFMAQTNPHDPTLIYTWKGLTGGYKSYLELKPFYIDIGIYNNAESRDLWEYKIPLSGDEKELMIKLLWELIQFGEFSYFFLDQNCSTYLLYLLEAIKPHWTFSSKNHLMVLPQATVSEIHNYTKSPAIYTSSAKKKIHEMIKTMNTRQKQQFVDGKNLKDKASKNPLVLDAIISYWKMKNYQAKTNLPEKQKMYYYQTLKKRAQLGESKHINYKVPIQEAPHLTLPYQKVSYAYHPNFQQLNIRYGFQTFDDPSIGHDRSSFINFLETSLEYNESKTYLKRLKPIQLISLQDFTWPLPALSWQIDSELMRAEIFDHSYHFLVKGLAGISKKNSWLQAYTMVGFAQTFGSEQIKVQPYLNAAIRMEYKSFNLTSSLEQFIKDRSFQTIQVSAKHLLKTNFYLSINWQSKSFETKNITFTELGIYF